MSFYNGYAVDCFTPTDQQHAKQLQASAYKVSCVWHSTALSDTTGPAMSCDMLVIFSVIVK